MATGVCFLPPIKRSLILLLSTVLTGCSFYESSGRKFLEAEGQSFAQNGASSAFTGCGQKSPTRSSDWTLFEKTKDADVYQSDSGGYQLLVEPVPGNDTQCLFKFSSAQEMYKESASAIYISLHQSPASN
jgi:hypothetical protein